MRKYEMARHSAAAFETVIEADPLQGGRMRIAPKGVDRARTIALLGECRAHHRGGDRSVGYRR
jgi:hypothetical protein